ncbi:MAG: hypothetical protein KGM43_10140 [Planctomycetota bacterium]|nr:hypothetical protein [Planctomycetota bacterium]
MSDASIAKRAGDAERRLAEAHLWVAESIAARFTRIHPSLADDLRSEAYVALVRAAIAFDGSRGVKFTTYAYHCVEGACRTIVGKASPFSRGGKPLPRIIEDDDAISHAESYEDPVGWEIESEDFISSLSRLCTPHHASVVRQRFLHASKGDASAAKLGYRSAHVFNTTLTLALASLRASIGGGPAK